MITSLLPRPGPRPLAGLAIVFALVCGDASWGGRAAAQVGDVQVKAAIVLNIAKFVQWPDSTAPLVIGVVGDRALAAVIAEADRRIGGRVVEVRAIEAVGNPAGCDVLYVGAVAPIDAVALLERVSGPVLTIGETATFLRNGGIVRIFFENRRPRFQINRRQADAAGLRLSSQLLSLAAQ